MSRSRPLVVLLAAALLAVLVAVPGGPVTVDAALASAPGGRLIVVWKGEATPELRGGGVARTSTSRWSRHRAVVTAEAGRTADVAARLLADPRVAAVVPDAPLHAAAFPASPPDDAFYAPYQPDLGLINVPGAWLTTRGSGVTVAVLDSGLDASHPDIAGASIVAAHNFVSGSAVYGSADVTDGAGHGTHVTGTIAARTNNGVGVAGIAPDVTVMPLKVLDDDGSGSFADLADAVDYAVANGADVINLSLGGALSASTAAWITGVMDTVRSAGVLVVAAAGNDGVSTPFYPAAVPSVISVAALDNAASASTRDLRASYSNFGPTIDIAAPGTLIASTVPGGLYQAWSGTSMASPHVAAIAALVEAAHPAWTPSEVEAAIEGTAVDLGAAGRDDSFGWGRINASAAIAWSTDPVPDLVSPTVSMVAPLAGSSGASEGSNVVVSFSEPVVGVSSATLRAMNASGVIVPASITFDSAARRATIDPVSLLVSTSTYRVQILAGIADLAGNPLAPVSFTFTTTDTIAPRVRTVYPAANAKGITRGVSPTITFTEPVTGASSTRVRLINLRTGRAVSVVVTYDTALRRVTINPRLTLYGTTRYRIQILSGIRDRAGHALPARNYDFTTRK